MGAGLRQGMDVERVRDVAMQIEGSGDRLALVQMNGSHQVEVLQQCWQGADSTTLVRSWGLVARQVDEVAQALRLAADRLLTEADQQDQASGAGAGAGDARRQAEAAVDAVRRKTATIVQSIEEGMQNGAEAAREAHEDIPPVEEQLEDVLRKHGLDPDTLTADQMDLLLELLADKVKYKPVDVALAIKDLFESSGAWHEVTTDLRDNGTVNPKDVYHALVATGEGVTALIPGPKGTAASTVLALESLRLDLMEIRDPADGSRIYGPEPGTPGYYVDKVLNRDYQVIPEKYVPFVKHTPDIAEDVVKEGAKKAAGKGASAVVEHTPIIKVVNTFW